MKGMDKIGQAQNGVLYVDETVLIILVILILIHAVLSQGDSKS